jgi:hypothetical protein
MPSEEKDKPYIYHNISLNDAMIAAFGIIDTTSKPAQPQDAAYISPPLEEDLKVWGPIGFTLYASTAERGYYRLVIFRQNGRDGT